MKPILLMSACALAVATAIADDEVAAENKGDAEAVAIEGIKAPKPEKPKVFTTLPFCRRMLGKAEVMKPGSQDWELIEEGRFYPLGSAYRTAEGARIELAFGKECRAIIEGNASFRTRAQGLDVESRTVVLGTGRLDIALPANLKEGLFCVTSPAFTAKNLAGESRYTYKDTGDGGETVVRCVTGVMSIEGRHFQIPHMRAANEFRLRGDADNLETILYGTSGDYIVKLDKGMIMRTDIDEDGKMQHKVEHGELDWHLSPETKVQINRAVPSIGERMSVSVLTFDTTGKIMNHFAYAEGRPEVNSGELAVDKTKNAKEVAKKAAEATAKATAATEAAKTSEDVTEEPASEDNTTSKEESNKKEESEEE